MVHDDNGSRRRLPVRRWHGPAEPTMDDVLGRCVGPTLDLGCGPGRLTSALSRAGVTAVGVDISAQAVRLTRARGAVALRADLFAPLPAEGRWAHVLLIDGNIGIGGDPRVLLARCRDLLRPGGTVLVELEPPGPGLWMGRARLAVEGAEGGWHVGPPFRWARLDTVAVTGAASAAGLVVRDLFRRDRRWFAELTATAPTHGYRI
ncbi:class I SAM-dependent methyltransferase [Micromonospora sp. WMMD1155]|uniref:class I SAM-dependent methyltransferase n=1 Tax=Micromonospora sp. WMMD1155 TaxID=3016094 RepID=UPI002499D0AB|nr:class I SAM-dependent methyltransferase [Micromonospora sp. WMMD1155]WFE55247.1 class I SAM-dependent methyltransferase [Micromonospora sp. WMMD1155]